ncbi:MAG: SO_0444 family Cu/Zn efflux transporter [Methanosarcina sp.]|uniref:SO_0444 family Cu/Zn efflux transporter n=1 Tax=Methanosarcina sp. TaxID=2213 RepID=UPI00261C684F|nr:SO_0444 family Cu/Zn efflux transporter [Methanosarcina sp.]MDD3245260.1 SO_0444 family Cu/Zn efflux transporter [Methanosarcina sp.]MDD4248320.1 SO_0444 family Cu/Zn efflux transporter [Methanosarcina sp.]
MSLEFLSFIPFLLSGILLASWKIFVEAAPYLIFGFGVAGLLNIIVPDQKIVDYLGTSAGKVRSVINASLAGLPLPLCSCGVIPAAMSIRKRGATRGATLSFLISTPQTGVDSIAITYALLDPLMTIFRPIATLATALLAGLADNLLIGEEPEKKGSKKQENPGKKAEILAVSTLVGVSAAEKRCNSPSCSSPSCSSPSCSSPEVSETGKTEYPALNTASSKTMPLELKPGSGKGVVPPTLSSATQVPEEKTSSCGCGHCEQEKKESLPDGRIKKSVKEQFLEGLKYAYIELPGEIAKWMLIGILLAGIISYAVPETLIQEYLGGGLGSMLVMLVVGIPLYICATASTPLAASLVAKGMSPGTAFVFLLAGPATNAATITMVVRFLGKRSAALYLGVISLCALGAGILLDWLYLKLGVSATATLGSAGELLPEGIKIGFAALLLPLMLYGVFRRGHECGCTECH